MSAADPHGNVRVLHAGAPLTGAAVAVVLVHGRGATAEDILGLADEVDRLNPGGKRAADLAWLAPQADGFTWYPQSFLAPLEANEPWLSSALAALGRVVASAEAAGVPRERIVLAGFSQGACLASEFAARHAQRWGGLAAFSGGLIGPDGTPRDYAGRFDGTPVFLGCSDGDPHIPAARVRESAAVFERMGAVVDARLYPNMGHTINTDELSAFAQMLERLA